MPRSVAAQYNVDERLLVAVLKGNQREALNMLTAFGANVDGSSQQDFRPLSWAAVHNNVGMIKFLVGKGAGLEAKTGALPSTEASMRTIDGEADEGVNGKTEITMTAARQGHTKGMTAVHVAIYYGQVAALRSLLQAGADPNALHFDPIIRSTEGITPLFSACNARRNTTPGVRVAMAHELLEAGADPCMTVSDMLPLHNAADGGDTGLIDLLLAKAPETLHHRRGGGRTPLGIAVSAGHEKAVLHLLSAGANESEAPLVSRDLQGPLSVTIFFKNESMMRLLLKEGLPAIGGAARAIPQALAHAVSTSGLSGYMRYVRLLLEVEWAERVGHWAKCSYKGWTMLHHAASNVAVAAVGVLLHHGAEETAVGSCGKTAMECVARAPDGRDPNMYFHSAAERDPETVAAVRRLLGRGPAYRARSWGWLAGQFSAAALASADPAGGAADTAPSPNSRPTIPLDVRIFRPENAKFYVRLVAR